MLPVSALTFEHHAKPPPGEWINDPNGLVFADSRYRLFVQHSDAAPDFKTIGWARLSSDDLVRWDWDGQVVAPEATGLAYSGSVSDSDGMLTAWLTRHLPPVQRQYRMESGDAGANWRQDATALGPEGRNLRDPFVFVPSATDARHMLLAEPCDWTDWRTDPPSRLSIWQETDGGWRKTGEIGPWSPPGVMWEVPVLLDYGTNQVLVVSMVDRRNDGAVCSVRAWSGRFDGRSFATDTPDGKILDHGPDFYATCFNTQDGWPTAERMMVAWASSWATARTMVWPGSVHGGAITLPRTINYRSGRLWQSPVAAARALARYERWSPGATLDLDFGGRFDLRISSDGVVAAERAEPRWTLSERLQLEVATAILIFEDCGLLEIFFEAEGRTMTVFIGSGDAQ